MKQCLRIGLLALWMLVTTEVRAEEGLALIDSEDTRYIELKPTFVTNYGENSSNRLSYVRTDITVLVKSRSAEAATKYHLPALRNSMVLILSRQDHAAVSSSEGRDLIREEALLELRSLLEKEEGEPFVEEVLFTNFIVQR